MTEAPGPDIALHGVTKRFGAHVAVDDVTLAVERSSFFALLGPSLERMDRRLIEAATDLYAGRVQAFLRVTLPLALPGVFAGTLLTFIPALGDFINAQLLGSSRQYMIGNVIQSQYLVLRDYPVAAALSFVLMAFILVGIVAYARLLGTRSLRESVA